MDKQNYYFELVHAMQSGVAMEMNYNSKATEPKHLRVGINSAMCEHAALVNLLVAKGIITYEEFADELIKAFEVEVGNYEKRLSDWTGANITLK